MRKSFGVPAAELKSMIDGLQSISEFVAGTQESSATMSFALLDTVGGLQAFESLMGQTTTERVFAVLMSVFSNEPTALAASRDFG